MTGPIVVKTASSSQITEYWQALGRFVDKFSQVERMLLMVLWTTAQVSPEVARAIFTDARIDKAKDTIARILDARGKSLDAFLTRAFQQLGEIARTRNDIVHYGAEYSIDHGFSVSNKMVAHTPGKLREFKISPEILAHMIDDLHTIETCFAAHWLLQTPANSHEVGVAFANAAQVPWRYKPSAQSQAGSGTRRKRRERSRQQGSSP